MCARQTDRVIGLHLVYLKVSQSLGELSHCQSNTLTDFVKMRSVLVTGGNRGIGLELVRQLVSHEKAPDIIIATCRKLQNATALQELSAKHTTIHILQLDVTEFSTYTSFTKTVAEIVGNEGLNVLINNAGISGKKDSKLGELQAEQFAEIYQTNTIAPILLTQAALNTATRSISHELKSDGILVMALHPGWVKTDMGGKEADLTTEFSVKEIIKTLFSLSEKHQGAFLRYDGTVLPW